MKALVVFAFVFSASTAFAQVPIEEYEPIEDPFLVEQPNGGVQAGATVQTAPGQVQVNAGYQLQQPMMADPAAAARLELENTLAANRIGGAIAMLIGGGVGAIGFGGLASLCYETDNFYGCEVTSRNLIFGGLALASGIVAVGGALMLVLRVIRRSRARVRYRRATQHLALTPTGLSITF